MELGGTVEIRSIEHGVTGYSPLTCRRALRVLLADGTLVPGPSPGARPCVPGPGGAPGGDARRLAGELARRRHAAGLTQQQLAGLLDWSVTAVGHAESGRVWQRRDFWVQADAALDAGGALLRQHDEYRAAQAPPATAGPPAPPPALPCTPADHAAAPRAPHRAPAAGTAPGPPPGPVLVLIVWTSGAVTAVRQSDGPPRRGP